MPKVPEWVTNLSHHAGQRYAEYAAIRECGLEAKDMNEGDIGGLHSARWEWRVGEELADLPRMTLELQQRVTADYTAICCSLRNSKARRAVPP
eukprot:5846740-Lingulodinium_polyedra.AAC.1